MCDQELPIGGAERRRILGESESEVEFGDLIFRTGWKKCIICEITIETDLLEHACYGHRQVYAF